MRNMKSRPIALVIPTLLGGGAERMWLNLANGLCSRGHRVDLVLLRVKGDIESIIPVGVRVFGPDRWFRTGALTWLLRERGQFQRLRVSLLRSLLAWGRYRSRWPGGARRFCSAGLARNAEVVRAYLAMRNPYVLLAALPGANDASILACEVAQPRIPVIATIRGDVVYYSPKQTVRARILYPKADMVIGVSRGVATGAVTHLNLQRERVRHIYNGIPVQRINELCERNNKLADGPFDSGVPVVLSADRLSPQKDHVTLFRAFALLRNRMAAKLVLLGIGQQGRGHKALLALAAELGVAEDVVFQGFDINPYPYMKAAAVLVLSSRWEGLPSVLVEAMACGTPVVSTDCPSGPSEILDSGQFGPLVPVGDAQRLADAIAEVLAGNHPPSDVLRARASEFSQERMTDEYERLIESLIDGQGALARLRAEIDSAQGRCPEPDQLQSRCMGSDRREIKTLAGP